MNEVLLSLIVAVFAFANGVNDGGALVASGAAIGSSRIWPAIVLLAAAVILVPGLLTFAVARTLGEGLVGAGPRLGSAAVVIAVVVTLAVVWGLSGRGVPTSLTLAFVGALSGAGVGAGAGVDGGTLARVLLLAALAPFAAAGLAVALGRMAPVVHVRGDLSRLVRRMHATAFTGLSLAYGVNDGQKMIAVGALVLGLDVAVAVRHPWPLALIGVSFVLGTLVGLRRVGSTIGSELVPLRPLRAVITQFSAAAAVAGTGLAGAPVSMTQSIVGGVVGAGMSAGNRRVRWPAVRRVGAAWVVTLPLAFAVAWSLTALMVRA